jgi:hypothetical protein
MTLEKPQWQIDAEQDLEALKDTPLIRLSAAQNNALAKGYQCKYCKQNFSLIAFNKHQESCGEVQVRKKEILEHYNDGSKPSFSEIARRLKRTKTEIGQLANDLNLVSWDYILERELEKNILELYKEKKNHKEIVNLLGTGNKAIGKILERNNIDTTSMYHKKINENHKAILNHYNDGTKPTYSEIASRMQMTEKAIKNVLQPIGYVNWSTIKKKEEDDFILDLLKKGLTPTAICNEHGFYFRRVKDLELRKNKI